MKTKGNRITIYIAGDIQIELSHGNQTIQNKKEFDSKFLAGKH